MSTALLVMWLWMHGQASVADKVSLIEISSYSEINGKLWACPVGSEMASEIEGKPDGENMHWVTFCKLTSQGETEHIKVTPNTFEEMWLADPVDVPAVQEPMPSKIIPGHNPQGADCTNHGMYLETNGNMLCTGGWKWTCSDKSRVLLTSEDGKRWCHKVQP